MWSFVWPFLAGLLIWGLVAMFRPKEGWTPQWVMAAAAAVTAAVAVATLLTQR